MKSIFMNEISIILMTFTWVYIYVLYLKCLFLLERFSQLASPIHRGAARLSMFQFSKKSPIKTLSTSKENGNSGWMVLFQVRTNKPWLGGRRSNQFALYTANL